MAALRATVDETRAAGLRTSGRRSAPWRAPRLDAPRPGRDAARTAMERHINEIGTHLLGAGDRQHQHTAPPGTTEAEGGKDNDHDIMVMYALVGLIAGVLAGLLGVGGGIVIVPMLVFCLSARACRPR